MSNLEYHLRLKHAFRHAVETDRGSLRHARLKDAGAITGFLNADDHDYTTHKYKGKFNPNKNPHRVKYIKEKILPHDAKIEPEYGMYNLYGFNRTDGKAICHMTLWFDDQGRTRISPYVLPSFRRIGLGQEFYEAVLSRAVQKGLFPSGEVIAEIEKDNLASQKFYMSLGFNEAGRGEATTVAGYEGKVMIPFVRILA